jgi:hypothetical protein
LKVTLRAPTHHPKINVRWPYTVKAVNTSGRQVRGKITVQIVDPVGQAHPAAYADTNRNIVDFPFKGTFRDYVQWPADSRGYPLTFRVSIAAPGYAKATVNYAVTSG